MALLSVCSTIVCSRYILFFHPSLFRPSLLRWTLNIFICAYLIESMRVFFKIILLHFSVVLLSTLSSSYLISVIKSFAKSLSASVQHILKHAVYLRPFWNWKWNTTYLSKYTYSIPLNTNSIHMINKKSNSSKYSKCFTFNAEHNKYVF